MLGCSYVQGSVYLHYFLFPTLLPDCFLSARPWLAGSKQVIFPLSYSSSLFSPFYLGQEGWDTFPCGTWLMYPIQYVCSARTWTSQAVPCLCIHEKVLKRMSFHQIELNSGSTLWGITGWFFPFICKCANLKNALFCQRRLIKHLGISVSANRKIINLCCKENSWGSYDLDPCCSLPCLKQITFTSLERTLWKITLMNQCFP